MGTFFKKVSYTTEIARYIWLLDELVRSLKSSQKEALKDTLLCEDYSDLTSPIRNHIHIAVTVVYGTFKIFFLHARSYCLILHFTVR